MRTWRKTTFKPQTRALKAKRNKIQKYLKPLCAQVRNEYSTARLQADFRAGLEQLYRADDDEGDDAAASDQPPRSSARYMSQHCWDRNAIVDSDTGRARVAKPAGLPNNLWQSILAAPPPPPPTTPHRVPKGMDMDVFCISANDFLKVQGIKPASDGPPATFTNAADTNIPALSDFVSDFPANPLLFSREY